MLITKLLQLQLGTRGPFLERPGNLKSPKSHFEIKVLPKVVCVLTSKEVHFVSLADNLTQCTIFKPFEIPISNGKQNSLTGPVITESFEKWAPGPVSPGWVLPYIGYIGMCGPKGYGFSAVLVINRVSILADFGQFGHK